MQRDGWLAAAEGMVVDSVPRLPDHDRAAGTERVDVRRCAVHEEVADGVGDSEKRLNKPKVTARTT